MQTGTKFRQADLGFHFSYAQVLTCHAILWCVLRMHCLELKRVLAEFVTTQKLMMSAHVRGPNRKHRCWPRILNRKRCRCIV